MNNVYISFCAVFWGIQMFLALPLASAQSETAALKDCTVNTKIMAKQFSDLALYMSRSRIDSSEANTSLDEVRLALGRAEEACEMFPEMLESLAALSLDVRAVGEQIKRR